MGNQGKKLSKKLIIYYANKILRGSEEALHQKIKLHKLSDMDAVRVAGGQRLIDELEKDEPTITHAELVDIVYEHVRENNIMQSSNAPLTLESIRDIHDEVSPGLGEEVRTRKQSARLSPFKKNRGLGKEVTMSLSPLRKNKKNPETEMVSSGLLRTPMESGLLPTPIETP